MGLCYSHNTVSDIRISARFDEKRPNLVNSQDSGTEMGRVNEQIRALCVLGLEGEVFEVQTV